MSPLIFCCGTGRAKGLGGPVAPAESSVVADGEGGGRTTVPCRCCAWETASAGFRGEFESPVALPPASDAPSGIWTVSRGGFGRAPPTAVLIFRLAVFGVSGREDIDVLRKLDRCCRCGEDDDSPFRMMGPLSAD